VRIVLDTNVLVSGLLSPFGAPAQIVRMVASGHLSLCYDARILAEYSQVLLRPKFPFSKESGEALVDQIVTNGIIVAGFPLRQGLPHKSDEPFLEVALAGEVTVLVTGNMKHYPKSKRGGMNVQSPAEFLERYRKR
jgi:putative PIN family toxin of toxin-antitoxin system